MTVEAQAREATAAGLRYVIDDRPGIRRERIGGGFAYIGPDGRPVDDQSELGRIKSLAIPPAWSAVWICPDALGHLQATGRDARGRKQYRYHPRWRAHQDAAKFGQVLAFGRALPGIRARVAQGLKRPGLDREKILTLVVQLLEVTLIRVGNEEYARENHSFGLTTLTDEHLVAAGHSFGLTTLTDEHLVAAGDGVEFVFRGKSGKEHRIGLSDRRLVRLVKQCQDLPGQQLFQYVDGAGHVRDIESGDVNAYIEALAGADFTAKDFRTWAGTMLVACELGGRPWKTQAQAKAHVVQAVKAAASRLGNTPAVCRKSYIHPAILTAYLDGRLALNAALGPEAALLQFLAGI